ncbi:MAG: hypothetical protein AMJ92_00075 [candidate division Zixibacteria bacterium SM23_81]|nr:MAG: hypothetical protein AMJ92_00075 [candidate division Zixibacteria bacterium SM23_81]
MNRAMIILIAVLCCTPIATAETSLNGEIVPKVTRDIVGSPLTFSKIAFAEYNPEEPLETNVDLWIVNPDGSELEKIFDGVVSTRVRFSPCGQFVAFKGQDGKHRIIDLEGNVLHEFTGGSRSENDFSWSPDVSYMLFGVYFDGIYKYNLGDSTKIRIVASSHRTYDHNPVVSPDSAKIVYTHHEYEHRYYIYTVDIDGGNKVLITNGSGTSYDEQLNLNWLDNDHFIFKIDPKNLIYYVNKGTHEVIGINPGVSFSKMKLSHNKETLAIFSGSSLYFIDASQLPTGIVTPYSTELYAQAFAWSYDTDSCYYVIRSSSAILRIFDKNDNEYEFLDPEDLPEDIGSIKDVDWSYGQVEVGPLVTPLLPNPMTWLQAPDAISTASIAMQATAFSGGHSPYSYEFDFVDSPTGGSGGTDSGWNGNSYADSGLRVNHQYRYRCRGKDNIGQTVDWSSVQSAYTEIESCTGVTFGAVTTTSIQAKSTNTPSGLTRGSSGLIIRNKTGGTIIVIGRAVL